MNKSLLRDIPKVDDLLRSPTLAHLFADAPRVSVTEALREELDNMGRIYLTARLTRCPAQRIYFHPRRSARGLSPAPV